jgi:hypothetical protein
MARSVIATDDFNRADGVIGANWSYLRDTAWNGTGPSIVSNVVRGSDGGGTHYQVSRRNAESFNDNQYAKITIGALSFSGAGYKVGVVVRASADTDSNADFYGYYVQDDGSSNRTTVLFKMVNGTVTTLDSVVLAWANGDTIEMEVEGTTLRGYKNGTLQVTVSGQTDLSTGKPGLYISGDSSTPSGDDWEGGNVTTSGGSSGSRLAGGRDPVGGFVHAGLVGRSGSGIILPRRRDTIVPSIHAAMMHGNFRSEAIL